jgi:hypothetical protein
MTEFELDDYNEFEHCLKPVYKAMAREATYYSAWVQPPPNPTPAELDAEAAWFARDFADREETWKRSIGLRNGGGRAGIYAIEAARTLCAVRPGLAVKLLRLALKDARRQARKRPGPYPNWVKAGPAADLSRTGRTAGLRWFCRSAEPAAFRDFSAGPSGLTC